MEFLNMAMDPTQLLQQLMQSKAAPQQPMPMQQPMPEQEPAQGAPPSDEEMLDSVHNAMGKRSDGGPPPGSGLKWENLQQDQAALEENPTPENISAFVEYWGEDKLPTNLRAGGNEPDSDDTESGN
jgi:hypothetical protein